MYEVILADIAQGSYDYIMAIMNYICFGGVCAIAVTLFVAIVITKFDWYYKQIVTSALVGLIALFVGHFWLEAKVGISLIVPPVGTIYFTEFMHVIQYIASVAVVVMGVYVFICAALKLVDNYQFGKAFVSGLFGLIMMLIVHGYLLDNFGILLIFPPNLW